MNAGEWQVTDLPLKSISFLFFIVLLFLFSSRADLDEAYFVQKGSEGLLQN